MRRDIVLMHIPKTGGTSLRIAFEHALRGHLSLLDYGPSAPETTPALMELVYKERKLQNFRNRFGSAPKGILLSGHFPADRYWHAFNMESFVTFLRHPVDRIFSAFTHWVTLRQWSGSFEEFLARPDTVDRYTRLFANVPLRDFGFIGFMEDFAASVDALSGYMGTEIPKLQLNTGDYTSTKSITEDQARYRPMVEKLCRQDIALYEQLLEERGNRFVANIPWSSVEDEYLGQVALKDGIAVGWLTNTKREFLCEVEILENGVPVMQVAADRYREQLKGRSSRTGLCGFRIDLRPMLSAPVAGSRTLSFRARHSNYELSNSPIRI